MTFIEKLYLKDKKFAEICNDPLTNFVEGYCDSLALMNYKELVNFRNLPSQIFPALGYNNIQQFNEIINYDENKKIFKIIKDLERFEYFITQNNLTVFLYYYKIPLEIKTLYLLGK